MRKENDMKAKKFLSLLMSLAMILTALPLTGVTAFAEDGTHTSGDFEYIILEDGTAEITDYMGNAETLDIPSKLDTYTVTSIGWHAFAYCESLTSVTIPDSVTRIDSGAFYECYNLTSVKIGNGVTSIGDSAFLECHSLTSVTIPDSVTEIGDSAFKECHSLTSITIPDSVTRIGDSAFYECYNLTSVTIPESVEYIFDSPFGNCYNLTEIKVDANNRRFTSQDGVLFDGDMISIIQYPIGNARKTYDIPKGVESINNNAFEGCSKLTSVTIPESVTSIVEGAFTNCSNLTEIRVDANNKDYSSQDGILFNKNKTELILCPGGKTGTYKIPNSVTRIGDDAFAHCSKLTSVTIPDSVTSIGGSAFNGTGYYNNPSNWENGVLYIDNCLVDENDVPQNYKINEGTRVIADYAFSGCSLKSVTIPDSVTSIGKSAFEYSNLTSITIGKGVTSIGEDAFTSTEYYNKDSNWENGVLYIDNCLIRAEYDYKFPQNYEINEGTRVIADYAFYQCERLKGVTIPDSVTSIGDWAFYWCYSLTSATIGNGVTSIGESAFYDCRYLESVTIGKSVTSIGDEAFCGCNSLTSVTIPNSVTSIGDEAFFGCNSLTSVTIPNSVTSIGEDTFEGCKSLTEINVDTNNKNYSSQDGVLFNKNKTELIQYPIGNARKTYDIPKGVTSIGDNAFEYCKGLTSVTIPNSVTSIGEGAFYECSGLTSVTIPESVTSIGEDAFGSCSKLTSVTIPNSVTSIGEGAFYECSGLTSVTIGKSVTSIGGMAFAYCESLTSVTIPDSVTSIGESAFYCCDSLTEIKVDTNNKNYSSQDGILFNKNKTELILCPGGKTGTYKIPNSVTRIGDDAFAYCSKLTSVTIPNSVTSIGESAFRFCDCLTGVTIPDSVTSIGGDAFDSCDSLTDIYILNKDCNIVLPEDPEYDNTIPTETTIHGYAGSTAETFAKENGNKFAVINGTTPDPDKQNAIGDVDGNKNITITDAKWILQNTVKSRTFTEAQAKAADLNKDGKITIVDAKWVLQIVVGLRDAQTLKPIKK